MTDEADVTPRVRPFYCPYCGEEDFLPVEERGFYCQSCNRRFAVAFLGLGSGASESGEPGIGPVMGDGAP